MDVEAALIRLGWPIGQAGGFTVAAAVREFQNGYGLGPALKVDGIAGPKTKAALEKSLDAGGSASKHVTWRECASKGNGWIKVDRALLLAFEAYAKEAGNTMAISIYRDPARNKKVKGSSKSQHLVGRAVDFPGRLTVAQVKALKVFTGIEYDTKTKKVMHGDVRTGATVDKPLVFGWPH